MYDAISEKVQSTAYSRVRLPLPAPLPNVRAGLTYLTENTLIMAEDEDVYRFLEKRNVPESVIEKMKEDKIDKDVIKMMSDVNLARYLPSYGDRIALMNYCKSMGKSSDKRKKDLLARLQKKLKLRREKNMSSGSESDDDPKQSHKRYKRSGNSNASKESRRIEMGWLNYNDMNQMWKVVRAKEGGGTRRLSVKKSSLAEDLMPLAKNLFFPNGVSLIGPISDFSFELRDFRQEILEDGMSVGRLYEETKLPLLKFYLATKYKINDQEDDIIEVQTDKSVDQQDVQSVDEIPFPDPFTFREAEVEVAVEVESIPTAFMDVSLTEEVSDGEISSSPSRIISFRSEHNMHDCRMESEILDDTVPYEVGNSSTSEEKKIMRLHRASILTEMIDYFMDEAIMEKSLDMKIINNNGEEEKAMGVGVVKDAITEFWEKFYDGFTTGVNCKIPYLRHDMTGSKWTAVGRILVKGWFYCSYFPVMLCPSFLEQVIFDEVFSDVSENFLNYIPQIEKDVLCKALKDFPSGTEFEELLDILANYNCRMCPSASNLRGILKEIAHKELLQEPRFVSDCWRVVCRPLRAEFCDVGGISACFKSLAITNKKVLKSLQFPETVSESHVEVKKYLKRFVSELSVDDLRKFSRFCTATDIMSYDELHVQFVTFESDFARRPIAHTCGNILELPCYDNYPQFRSQFLSILKSDVWDMDIM